jgi:choline dehydrogenase-like flavoprotein
MSHANSGRSPAHHSVDAQTASLIEYDAVIIGAGVSGAIIANALVQKMKDIRVLILEAGPGDDFSIRGYDSYVNRFYSAVFKGSNSPYRANPNANMPVETDFRQLSYGRTDSAGYVVQRGPVVLDGTYARVTGGTTMHWQGNVPRMLPEDFEMRTRFGRGVDWPISYADLMPYYSRAELELGASADMEEQQYAGITFEPGYVYPMRKMPATYLDRLVAERLDGTEFYREGERYELKVRGIPQARNGIPNPAYNNGQGYQPYGSVSSHQDETGMRCQGNTNCTPICPVQAKYDARRTLAKALQTGRVHFLPQAVASKVHVDSATGRVTGIEYKRYEDPAAPAHTVGVVKGRVYILASNAIENARLMLASGLASSSGLVGRNLMNHVYLFAWGLMPKIAGAMRGTQGTSGIEELRGGAFRKNHAGFHIDIINNGWTYATGAPYTDLDYLVDDLNRFGPSLRSQLADRISRQLLLAFMVDVPADPNNRVAVDSGYVDALGNLRPVVSYGLSEYSIAGAAFGREISRRIFQRLGVEDHTAYSPLDYGYMFYNGQGLTLNGGNHFSGTHVMGTDPCTSVVDVKQRSWDHPNLFLTGSGSMPSIGTSNPTLTLAALGLATAETIIEELGSSVSTPATASAA